MSINATKCVSGVSIASMLTKCNVSAYGRDTKVLLLDTHSETVIFCFSARNEATYSLRLWKEAKPIQILIVIYSDNVKTYKSHHSAWNNSHVF